MGVAHANREEWENASQEILNQEQVKAFEFQKNFGGQIYKSYTDLLNDESIDAVYIPLPPALHFHWAKQSLLKGKHILVEKPCTTSLLQTRELTDLAEKQGLAIHENYMFIFHDQIEAIDRIVKSKLGDIRLFRISFGFPRRSMGDFRYNKQLGGGALLDCGGYTLKYASLLLGKSAKIIQCCLNEIPEFEVDVFGSAVLVNDEGINAQISFGMDNSYKCDLEVWGSKGSLFSGRVFTAPPNLVPNLVLTVNGESEKIDLPEDDSFVKSLKRFRKCIDENNIRSENYSEILRQAELVEEFKKTN